MRLRRPRAINVPLARGHDGPGGAADIVSIALLGLNVSVDRVGDGGVGATCFVLVDDRGALAVVAHPRHQISKPHAAPGRPGVPRMPQIMEVQALRADRAYGMRPSRLPVEVPAPQGPALGARKDQCAGISGNQDRQVPAKGWDDRAGDADDPATGSRLGRPEDDLTRGSLGECGANPHRGCARSRQVTPRERRDDLADR